MATRAVSKTANPGSSPGSPALLQTSSTHAATSRQGGDQLSDGSGSPNPVDGLRDAVRSRRRLYQPRRCDPPSRAWAVCVLPEEA